MGLDLIFVALRRRPFALELQIVVVLCTTSGSSDSQSPAPLFQYLVVTRLDRRGPAPYPAALHGTEGDLQAALRGGDAG